jgi:hypothetical protein
MMLPTEPPTNAPTPRVSDPAALARLQADFARDFGVKEVKWTDRNEARFVRSTGERPERAAELRDILHELGAWGGGVFDHCTMWGRKGQPCVCIGHPYSVGREDWELLRALPVWFPSLRCAVDDRPSFYGHGTHHVRIELIDPRAPFKPLPATHKTRAAARKAREVFSEIVIDGGPALLMNERITFRFVP